LTLNLSQVHFSIDAKGTLQARVHFSRLIEGNADIIASPQWLQNLPSSSYQSFS
jgi:hypothetical protein